MAVAAKEGRQLNFELYGTAKATSGDFGSAHDKAPNVAAAIVRYVVPCEERLVYSDPARSQRCSPGTIASLIGIDWHSLEAVLPEKQKVRDQNAWSFSLLSGNELTGSLQRHLRRRHVRLNVQSLLPAHRPI